MHPTRRILGIDPGSHHLGVGCIEKRGNQVRLIYADILHAPRNREFYERLDSLNHRMREIVDKLAPTEVAIEDIFFAKNVRSAFTLGIARGVAIASCLGRGVKIYEYAPTQVKAVVTGSGRADKAQVSKMVRLILGVKVELGFDATDAIAVALCHANQNRQLEVLNAGIPARKNSIEKSGE